MRAGSWHHVAEAVLLALLVLPLVASCIGVILPAAGFFPALGGTGLSWQPMRDALATPGLATAITLTLGTALAPRRWRWPRVSPYWRHSPAPAPAAGSDGLRPDHRRPAKRGCHRHPVSSGAVRLVRAADFAMADRLRQAPAFALVPDPHGGALVFALLPRRSVPASRQPSALSSLPARRLIDTGRSLGYGRAATWIYLVLPLVYRRIRLPLAAVMIFALSVIDMPRLLGPSLPPPLAVLAVEGFEHADLARRLPAGFLACLQVGVTLLALLVWRGGEIIAGVVLSMARRRALRIRKAGTVMAPVALIGLVPPAAAVAGLVAAAIWSLAASWFFPCRLADGLQPARLGAGSTRCCPPSPAASASRWPRLSWPPASFC